MISCCALFLLGKLVDRRAIAGDYTDEAAGRANRWQGIIASDWTHPASQERGRARHIGGA